MSAPWSSKPGVLLRGVPPKPRLVDLLDVAFASACKDAASIAPALVADCFFCDISQNICQRPWGKSRGTATTSTNLYSYEYDRTLVGADRFRGLGHVRALNYSGLSKESLNNLTGESISLPCLDVIFTAAFAPLQFSQL